MNGQEILSQTQAQIAKRFPEAQDQPVKVINSLQRKVAHLVRQEKQNPVLIGSWKKALDLAEKALQEAHKDHFVPCDIQCMTSAHKECVCHCQGKNHGVMLAQAAS